MNKTGLREECGVVGAYNLPQASKYILNGLHMLQHRGQDGAGIITNDQNKFYKYKNLGLVKEVFGKYPLESLEGRNGIGHVRYATNGNNEIENIQPFLFYKENNSFALCHNGNIVNSKELKNKLSKEGILFQSNSDSELVAHLIMQNYQEDILEAIKEALNYLDGAFVFLILTEDALYVCRDKYGLRPVSIAKLDDGYFVASETAAIDYVEGEVIYNVKPGEIVKIDDKGLTKEFYSYNNQDKMCVMEYIYFARPDSIINNKTVHNVRVKCGEKLAEENPQIQGDVVIGVPDSGLSAAVGVGTAKNIPRDIGLIKHKNIGRTFIESTQIKRDNAVKMKLAVIKEVVCDKDIILVDDSIVRGTTLRNIIKLLRKAGARKIHVFVASPPIKGECFYGVDIKSTEELIANNVSNTEICQKINADTLSYLTLEGLKEVLAEQDICHGCLNLKYPTNTYGGNDGEL